MGAWYNDTDPFVADWLRRLIKAGHIAPGVVDTRDIRDIHPNDLKPFTQLAPTSHPPLEDVPLMRIGALSSPVSAAGPSRSAPPAGRMIGLSGPDPAPANPSQARAGKRALTTTVTSGRTGSGSSQPCSLQQGSARSGLKRSPGSFAAGADRPSLENRLHQSLPSHGSTLYRVIWKQRVTPLGRPISALRASVRRTSASASGSAPRAGWRTPLAQASQGGCRTLAQLQKRQAAKRQINLQDQVILAGWATPRAGDADKRGQLAPDPRTGLPMQVQYCGWPTPTARDHKDGRESPVPINGLLGRQVWTTHGATRTGFGVVTTAGDRLNPAFARWLMG